jgi:hypothetical protein
MKDVSTMSEAQQTIDAWQRVIAEEHKMVCALASALLTVKDQAETLRRAIGIVSQRSAALRILLLFGDGELREHVFPELVDAASVGHSDIDICRAVIKAMPRKWVLAHIEPLVDRVIASDPNDDEFYRRYAELYLELDDELLRRLIDRMAQSESPMIREIAEDFQKYLK